MNFKKYLQKDKLFEEFEYFVSFYDVNTNEVIHICGYENYPKVRDINHLFEELKTDNEFGMPSDYVDNLSVGIFHKKQGI